MESCNEYVRHSCCYKGKYAAMPPPDDFPLYGDDVIFVDKANGKRYRGTVLEHHWTSRISYNRNAWKVQVNIRLDDGEKGTEKDVWCVEQSEIEKVIRK